jgi:extracellular factor (EF) 3-hydroxypalmitic acid methyl ester biosynthesis protein
MIAINESCELDTAVLADFLSAAAALQHALEVPSAASIVEFVDRTREHYTAVPNALLKTGVFPRLRRHPVFNRLMEDPHTARAYWKPRGYAGDAVMMDFMYDQQVPAGTSRIGRAVFEATTGLPNAASVRHRRDLLTSMIDDMARLRSRPSILSIACGHLREAQLSAAVAAGRVGRFYALDQDEMSVERVRTEQADSDITAIRGSIGTLIRNASLFSNFDLIYAAGLFDYLNDSIAASLIETMASCLAPGGVVLVGNFVPSNHSRPYMEAIMDWHLVLRDASDLRRLADSVLQRPDIDECAAPVDPHGNIAYLKLVKSR